MTAVEIVLSLLRADAATIAVVAPKNIKMGELAQDANMPKLGVNTVSIADDASLVGTPRSITRVQVTVFAGTYAQMLEVRDLVRAALMSRRINAGGVPGASIWSAGAGPDFRDEQGSFWMVTCDFRVSIPA